MVLLQENCPGGIHMSYILSTTDSPLLMFSASKVKEQLNFQVSDCENLNCMIGLHRTSACSEERSIARTFDGSLPI